MTMNRRRFMIQSFGAALSLSISRIGRSQSDSSSAEPPPQVSICVGGDVTLGDHLQDHLDQRLAAGKTKEESWPLYFGGVRSFFEATDIVLVNLECPFTERGKKLKKNVSFRARPELVQILKAGSVHVVSLANDHTADWGKDGVIDTIETLSRNGIDHFGAGLNLEEARKPAILERNGLSVGLLGYYFQAEPDMLEPKQVYATKKGVGVAGCYKDLDCIRQMVREDVRALTSRVDIVIPYFHWGHEGSHEVRDYQVELAHLCVDLGCKAVLGAHPHRVQGIEVYRGAPIFYSLGNFVYGGLKESKDTLTMIARLVCTKNSTTARVFPTQFTLWPEAPFQPFVLGGAAGDEGMARIMSYSTGFPATLPQLEEYRGRPVPAEPDSVGTAR